VSSGFLLSLIHADSAFALNGDLSDVNIHKNGNNEHNNILSFFDIWRKIGHGIMVAFDWVIHLNTRVNEFTVHLFGWVYQFLVNTILCTPLFIFNNAAVFSEVAVFSGVSVFLVTLLSMIEGIKKMIKQRKVGFSRPQDHKKTWKRYFVATAISGSAPFLFATGFKVINQLIKLLSSVGVDKITSFNLFSNLHIPGLGILDTLLMLLFDIVVIGLLIPISLQAGRRFWNLMCLTSLTPLSMAAWVFDEHRHYFYLWWRNIKKLAQSQLVVAFFITMMGLFIFGTSTITNGNLFPMVLMIFGGLYSMINPPSFVKSRMDNGETIEEVGEDVVRKTKGLIDTLTLKNVRTFQFLKNRQKNKSVLRQKYGRRYIKNLK
jgi:hypothetical protein